MKHRIFWCAVTGTFFFIAHLLAFAQETQGFPGDTQFLDAREAFRLGKRPQLEALARDLQAQNYVLADYADYYLLRQGLENQDAGAVLSFILAHQGQYLGERMRADWLRALSKQGEWRVLLEQFSFLESPDQESRCLALLARVNMREAGAQEEGRAQWLTLADASEGCQALLSFLEEQMPYDLRLARVRLLFELNRVQAARKILLSLPAGSRPDARQLDLLIDKSPVWLSKLNPSQLGERAYKEMLSLSLQRLARNDPAYAAAQMKRWSPYLDEAQRQWLWGQIGLYGAYRHMGSAGEWFSHSLPSLLSKDAAEWKVRVALRQKNWKLVREAIESMPLALKDKPEWIYWLGRAQKAGGQRDEARQLFGRIAGQPHFYGNLADEELGLKISLPPQASPPQPMELALVRVNPSLIRALAFFRLDLRLEGIREWNWAIRNMNDRQLLAAAELAFRQKIYDRAISTAEKTKEQHDYKLRFLSPFSEEVRSAARDQALDDAWVYGLMRQESRFVTSAKSSAGASGLMQLMPATARWVARQIGLKDYDPRRVADLEINLLLGTSYMRMVMESLDNHPVLASAAYNAGPGRARKWRAAVPLEGAIYAETIPFDETRDYVKKVMSNTLYYALLFEEKPVSLHTRMGLIAPLDPASSPPDLP